MTDKKTYSFKIGLIKSIKNAAIMFIPASLAFLASVPIEYSPLAGIIAYGIKNYIENR